MRNVFFVFIIVFAHRYSVAQKFWLTTYEFPGREKTGITITPNNQLYVSLTNGVITSSDYGNSFNKVLVSNSTYCIYSNKNGDVFVGGEGKIYITKNEGQLWDSIALNTNYPISKIIQNSKGDLFAITGILGINGYEGDGVFFSHDGGNSWQKRNNGLGIYTCIEQIVLDKNDRIYIAAADELVTGNGGLFVSDNNGLSWQHVDLLVNGKGIIDNKIKIANTWNISISKSDSVYFSFFGTAVNSSVRLNTVKHIADIQNNSFWNVYQVSQSPTWWQDKLLNSIFFASNGDVYSSVSGTILFGGTFFKKNQSSTWSKINYGLGVDVNGYQNIQYFAENGNGKIYMVQLLDEKVYFTDTSAVTSISNDENYAKDLLIYPNPVVRNEKLTIKNLFTKAGDLPQFKIFNNKGLMVSFDIELIANKYFITMPSESGLYILLIEYNDRKLLKKIVVH